MENFNEKACLCALNRIFGFEPKIALALIDHFGSATDIFKLNEKDIEQLTGPYFKYKGLIKESSAEDAAHELYELEKQGIRFCGITETDYPALLKECPDPPVGIYIRSCTPIEELWRNDMPIGIIGTRDISPYGKEWCTRIVQALAQSNNRPLIISGLALGTDIEAHKASLDFGLPTIGVMATGPDSIYPIRNRSTAETMASTRGCALITDYPPGTAPLPIHFLRRNRIIAGLSKSVILIESKVKGGGLNTCRLAFSYNRDIYALPGRIDDLHSQGCNMIIREKIAEPITSTASLLESLGVGSASRGGKTTETERLLLLLGDKYEQSEISLMLKLIQYIKTERGITVEDLSHKSGLGYRRASELTSLMEIEGLISIDILQRCSINYKNV